MCVLSGAKRVIITGLDETKLEKVLDEIGENCIPIRYDISDVGELDRRVDIISYYLGGRIDGIVNNAVLP